MASATVTVSAPGRVNLIGEHTDYSLLPVLPIAIQRRITVHAQACDNGIVTAVSDTFAGSFRSDSEDNPAWSRYVHAAVKILGSRSGAHLHLEGDLPPTGGLSSSSALTVAVVRSLLELSDSRPSDDHLIDLAVRAERGAGVEGGAMDQTVIVRAQAGEALRIDFDPPAHRPVAVPPDVAFVVGYSGAPAQKGDEARDRYNARVVGCRTAAHLLGLDPPILGRFSGTAKDAVESLPDEAVPPEGLRLLSEGRFEDSSPLPVKAYARHVLTEAVRVDDVEAALRAGDIDAVGSLFDASHASLAGDFGVSTPGLDALVSAAREAGASGARLTGAGFGGWAVAVSPVDRSPGVLAAMATVAGEAFVAIPSEGVR